MTARRLGSRWGWGSVVVALLLAASPASAAPAVVQVFEAPARGAPGPDAPVLHVFPEETKIFVSEEVTDGWRKVRLPDGKTAYVRDDQIKLLPEAQTETSETAAEAAVLAPRRPAAPPVEPLPKANPRPRPARVRTTIYVKDLDHLAELVESDRVVHPMAEDLASRHTIAKVAFWGGSLAGAGLMLASVTILKTKECNPGIPGYPDICANTSNLTAMMIGLGIALAGTIGWWAVTPKRSDLLDVINTWNGRHPDEPFTLDHEPGLHD